MINYASNMKPEAVKIDAPREAVFENSGFSKLLAEKPYLAEALRELGEHDAATQDHCLRVAQAADYIADRLRMAKEDRELLVSAALAHDIGKRGVDRRILQKPGRLGEQEWEAIMAHPKIGYQYLLEKGEQEVAEIVVGHHEFQRANPYSRGWKAGAGKVVDIADYKQRKSDDRTARLTRLVAMIDAFDSMAYPRPYVDPKTQADRRRELEATFCGSPSDAEAREVIKLLEEHLDNSATGEKGAERA